MQWDADFEAKVASLTVEQVRDAMRKHLDVNKMVFMKGGDFESASAAGGAQ
jgi:zinc protease